MNDVRLKTSKNMFNAIVRGSSAAVATATSQCVPSGARAILPAVIEKADIVTISSPVSVTSASISKLLPKGICLQPSVKSTLGGMFVLANF